MQNKALHAEPPTARFPMVSHSRRPGERHRYAVNTTMLELPADLLRYIADSEVEVVSWSADSDEMVLRVTKDIGPETGLLRLKGVVSVRMPPRFDVAAIAAYDGPFPDYPDLQLDEGEFAVAFQESWGAVYVVTAEGLTYDKIA